ncbi:hypothetical protein [Paenarthrobacter sp. C1]|uniref:hypothetical protein n=1 Tax=Paenarthrobacter sp. C1 TaxID=3400220 RepID=UPI003BF4EBB1
MPISWSDAVADADSSDAPARYRRALQQVEDIRPLVESYIQALKDSGQWPMEQMSDWSPALSPVTIYTRSSPYHERRCVSVSYDGFWAVHDHVTGDKGTDILVTFHPGEQPALGSERDTELFMTDPRFNLYMDAMERLKDWLPRELVASLRSRGIPIPEM